MTPFYRRSLCAVVTLLFGLSAAAQTTQRDVDLQAADGTALKATYFSPGKPGPAVMLFHQCVSERSTWQTLARHLAERGIHVLTMDYRGFGESGGPRIDTLSQQEVLRWTNEVWPRDIDIAFDFLLQQPGVDGANLGAGGASCGVNQSIQLARRHSAVKTLALLSGNTDEQGRNYLQHAAWMPVLAAASHDDGSILPYMRWLLGFSSNPQNQMLEYQAAGHGTDMFAVEAGLEPALLEWFTQHLLRSPVKSSMASAAKPAPLAPSAAFWTMLNQPGGPARAKQVYAEAKQKDPNVILFPEAAMNTLGYQRLQAGNTAEAIQLFELNVAAYPESANVYDSLGDAYLAAGRVEEAKEQARKAIEKLATDPSLNEQGRQAIRQSAEQKLRAPQGGGSSGGAAPQTRD